MIARWNGKFEVVETMPVSGTSTLAFEPEGAPVLINNDFDEGLRGFRKRDEKWSAEKPGTSVPRMLVKAVLVDHAGVLHVIGSNTETMETSTVHVEYRFAE